MPWNGHVREPATESTLCKQCHGSGQLLTDIGERLVAIRLGLQRGQCTLEDTAWLLGIAEEFFEPVQLMKKCKCY